MLDAIKTTMLAAVCVVCAGLPSQLHAQTAQSGPDWQIRDGRNELALYERFSMTIRHSAKIRRVLYDDEAITINTLEGDPSAFQIYAAKACVTTVTVIDEFDKSHELEVLVRGDVRHLESFIRRLYPDDSIAVEEISDSSVRLQGWVTRPEHVSEIQAIAEQFYPDVLNHMQAGGVQQIMLKCTVLEVQRSKLRRLGMNFTMVRPDGYLASTPGPIVPLNTVSAGGFSLGQNALRDSTVTWGLTRPTSNFQGFVQAMIEEGIFKTHATPMIVTHNGRPANFLSGGELPIPIAGGLGTTGVQYREFGIQLNTVPYVLGNGRIRLEVETRVSDQDLSNIVTINGTTTTAFRTNSANTQVEMNFGEALVIAGLVSRRAFGNGQKLPFFGELPWIGAAFSRKQFTESETELIIMVTPELVAPMSPAEIPAVLPGKSSDTPVDRELFFHGLMEVPSFGDACDCPLHQPGVSRCSDPNCPRCREGSACAKASAGRNALESREATVRSEPRTDRGEKLIRPQRNAGTKALPASSGKSSSARSNSPKQTPRSDADADTDSGTGLISPTMR
ncbi:MAG: type II and III secretion system protein family protein [Planctomycetota bacterium]